MKCVETSEFRRRRRRRRRRVRKLYVRCQRGRRRRCCCSQNNDASVQQRRRRRPSMPDDAGEVGWVVGLEIVGSWLLVVTGRWAAARCIYGNRWSVAYRGRNEKYPAALVRTLLLLLLAGLYAVRALSAFELLCYAFYRMYVPFVGDGGQCVCSVCVCLFRIINGILPSVRAPASAAMWCGNSTIYVVFVRVSCV